MKAAQLRERIIEKAMDDIDFRSRLLTDPHKALADEFNLLIPEGQTLRVVENAVDTEYLVLPANLELDDVQLSNVSGGGDRGASGTGTTPSAWSSRASWQDNPIFHD